MKKSNLVIFAVILAITASIVWYKVEMDRSIMRTTRLELELIQLRFENGEIDSAQYRATKDSLERRLAKLNE